MHSTEQIAHIVVFKIVDRNDLSQFHARKKSKRN